MDADKIEAAKEVLIKGLAEINNAKYTQILAQKANFPYDKELTLHLSELGLLELVSCMVWIPFDRFDSIEPLGKGGFATVYRGIIGWGPGEHADDYTLGKMIYDEEAIEIHYALKEISVNMLAEVIFTARLSLLGPNITMKLIGLTQDPDTNKYLMIMECAMSSLERNALPLDPPDPLSTFWLLAFRSAYTLAYCLDSLHCAGLIHHDLHPGNVVFRGENPRIIDVGLSDIIGRSHLERGVYGRMDYLPPEVFRGEKQTEKSDIYCLGTLIWQMVVGVPPRGTAAKLRADGMREERVPGMPEEFAELIEDCWRVDPHDRPTAKEVCQRVTNDCSQVMRFLELAPETREYILRRRAEYEAALDMDENSSEGEFEFLESGGYSKYLSSSQFHSYEKLGGMSGKVEVEKEEEGAIASPYRE